MGTNFEVALGTCPNLSFKAKLRVTWLRLHIGSVRVPTQQLGPTGGSLRGLSSR